MPAKYATTTMLGMKRVKYSYKGCKTKTTQYALSYGASYAKAFAIFKSENKRVPARKAKQVFNFIVAASEIRIFKARNQTYEKPTRSEAYFCNKLWKTMYQ